MSSMKKNKGFNYIILGVLFVLIILILLIIAIIPNGSDSVWGNRLDEVSKYPISDDTINKIKDSLESSSSISKTSISITGTIINVFITFNDDINKDKAKTYPVRILESLNENELKSYDVQVYLLKENEDDSFPIIGYKHKTSNEFSYSHVGE